MSRTLVGYARVSTVEQELALQLDALERIGCEKIFTDYASGAKFDRKGLLEALAYLRNGDAFVVWRLDRLGRSLKDLTSLVEELQARDIEFISIQESLNTGSVGGKLVFHIFAALAEFERNLIRERTNAGLSAARKRGRLGGRPRKISPIKEKLILEMYDSRAYTLKQIASAHGIGRNTIYTLLKRRKANNS